MKIVSINPSNFPEIEATIEIITGTDELVKLEQNEVILDEKKYTTKILEVINPKVQVVPASIVLVIDISGSMNEERLLFVRNAAINFVNTIDLNFSEIAIVAFNSRALLVCDYTHEKYQLIQALVNLKAKGGTSYDEAFMDDYLGALKISRGGRFEKKIIFLTDGQSQIDEQAVLTALKHQKVETFCISVELPMPESLRNIAARTGGAYYEALQSEEQLNDIYYEILARIQEDTYAKVRWRTGYSCDTLRMGEISYRGLKAPFRYRVPLNKIGSLKYDSKEIHYGDISPDTISTRLLEISAVQNPVTITHITSTSPKFKVLYNNFPYILEKDSLLTIPVQYLQNNIGMDRGFITVSARNCPDQSILHTGGVKEQLEVTFPVGGEKLIWSSDTTISWKGINHNTVVDMFFRKDTLDAWHHIGNAANYKLSWNTRVDTTHSGQLLFKPRAVKGEFYEPLEELFIPFQAVSLTINPKNNNIVAGSARNEISLLKTGGKQNRMIWRGVGVHNILFNQQGNILAFKNNNVQVHLEAGYGSSEFDGENIIQQCVIHENETACYLPSKWREIRKNGVFVLSPFTMQADTIHDMDNVTAAGITNNGEYGVVLTKDNLLKVWYQQTNRLFIRDTLYKVPERIIISPDQKRLLVEYDTNHFAVWNMQSGMQLYELKNYRYKQFSHTGEWLLANSTDNQLCFFDVINGKLNYSIPSDALFRTAYNNKKILTYYNDTLTELAHTNDNIQRVFHSSSIVDFKYSPNDEKIALIRSTGVHLIKRADNFETVSEIQTKPSKNYLVSFTGGGDSLVIISDSEVASTFGLKQKIYDRVVSNVFSVVKPNLAAERIVYFGAMSVNAPRIDKQFMVYRNKGQVPVHIKNLSFDDDVFQLVNNYSNVTLEPGDSLMVEMSFKPLGEGRQQGVLTAETDFGFFTTEVIGTGYVPSYSILNDFFNLGNLNLGSKIDSNLALLVNEGMQNFNIIIEEQSKTGHDITYEKLNQYLLEPGDTLKLATDFTALSGGRKTIDMVLIDSVNSIHEHIQLYGEVNVNTELQLILQGYTLNCDNNTPIDAEIKCIDLESNMVYNETATDTLGLFSCDLKNGHVYGVFATKIGYIASNAKIDLTKNTSDTTINLTFNLCKINIGTSVRLNLLTFNTASAEIKPSSYLELDKLIELLSAEPTLTIDINGHTDNVGEEQYNMELSLSRANAVKDYLVKNGVYDGRIDTRGWGDSKPIRTNDTEEGRSYNRRVEIVFD